MKCLILLGNKIDFTKFNNNKLIIHNFLEVLLV